MHGDARASFAEQLAALRPRADLSLADVGAAAHVARGYVHHIEHGRRWPTQRAAKALGARRLLGPVLAQIHVIDDLVRQTRDPVRAAELAATTGSALATRELRRVHAAMRERGADAQARALAEYVRTLADELG